MKPKLHVTLVFAILAMASLQSFAQNNSADSMRSYKNVVRYNLSGALLFGFDKYIVLGYERILSPHRSFSINVGKAALPKLVELVTDSFATKKEGKRTGYNVSVDYRFYLAKENKYNAPHGLYIGPYYSFSQSENERDWTRKSSTTNGEIITNSKFTVHTVGFELGYQFILWKRLALDMVMVGPGLGFYRYEASFSGSTNLSAADKEQLLDGLKQLLVQKFPGMNYVFSDKQINSDGVMTKSTVGYRYIVHLGFAF